MSPHEPCKTCGSLTACEHSALITDLRRVAPHKTPPTSPRAVPLTRAEYMGGSIARHIHARGPHCSACVEGWPVRCECGGHVHCGPAPQRPICERSPGGGCNQPRPVRDDAS